MALSGTLKDFGIADILQLIGNQTKTGSLLLKSGKEEVEVAFAEGHVVFASEKARQAQNFLGHLLVRAACVTEEQLAAALQEQQRSLKRLGDILVEKGAITKAALGQMMRLQTTETLYKLFRWKNGTYEFTQREIDQKASFDPIRAESILLEGFRRMDEWPAVRKKVASLEATCERVKELDVRDLPPLDEGKISAESSEGDESPGPLHKLIYRLAEPGRTLTQIADLTRQGEFETLKALLRLVDWGYLRVVPPPRGTAAAVQGLARGGRALARGQALLRAALGVVVFAGVLLALRAPALGPRMAVTEVRAVEGSAARLLGRGQLLRIESALELYRLEHGQYPDDLSALVEDHLLDDDDLRYPFADRYHYRRNVEGSQQSFVLLPPLD